MAELPIKFHTLKSTPDSAGTGGRDGYRWHVGLGDDDGEMLLVVDLSDSQAVQTGLGRGALHDRLPRALQRYAGGVLQNDLPVLDQIGTWNSPIVLKADHFE
jgi:hypothetical protein